MAIAVPLFSGSKGNSYYIGTSSGGVLIDAGKNCKQIVNALTLNDIDINKIGAIFITHEHSDHCSGLKVFGAKYGIKIYASLGTMNALEEKNKIDARCKTDIIENEISVGDMLIKRINTPHDAAESCCYRVTTSDQKNAVIATDMGVMTDGVRNACMGSDFVVLESNHDIEMLKQNLFYPPSLKSRILSSIGHLSNVACSAELVNIVKSGTSKIMLGHLSEQNNTPKTAITQSVSVLQKSGLKYKTDYLLDVASPDAMVKTIIF